MAKSTNDKHNNRENILEAAARLFAAKGFNGVSVREIAEEASVTKPVIYYYFDNKNELHETIIRDAFANMTEIHEFIFQSVNTVEAQLRELIQSHFQYCLDNPDIVKVLYDSIGRSITEKGLDHGRPSSIKGDITFRKFSDFIRNGQAEGFIRQTVDPSKAGMMMLGAMNIFILTHLHSDRQILSNAVANELMDMFLYGITNEQDMMKEKENS